MNFYALYFSTFIEIRYYFIHKQASTNLSCREKQMAVDSWKIYTYKKYRWLCVSVNVSTFHKFFRFCCRFCCRFCSGFGSRQDSRSVGFFRFCSWFCSRFSSRFCSWFGSRQDGRSRKSLSLWQRYFVTRVIFGWPFYLCVGLLKCKSFTKWMRV